MKTQTAWQAHVISLAITLAVTAVTFFIKYALGQFISIDIKLLCLGAAVGAGLSLLLKRPAVLLWVSAALLLAWMSVPATAAAMSVVYGAGCLGLLGSIPFTASLLPSGRSRA